ncbi:MAG TPA: hypothetical protein VNI35_05185 [Nitrospira sp.]|nr:hypothetical protein [Nitrospira sp.]
MRGTPGAELVLHETPGPAKRTGPGALGQEAGTFGEEAADEGAGHRTVTMPRTAPSTVRPARLASSAPKRPL